MTERNGLYKNLKITGLIVTLIITVSSVTAAIVLSGNFENLEARADENKTNIAELRRCFEETKDQLAELKSQMEVIKSQQTDVIKTLDKIDRKLERR